MGIVIMLLATLLLSAIGAALALASATELTIAGHFQRGSRGATRGCWRARSRGAGAPRRAGLELRARWLCQWRTPWGRPRAFARAPDNPSISTRCGPCSTASNCRLVPTRRSAPSTRGSSAGRRQPALEALPLRPVAGGGPGALSRLHRGLSSQTTPRSRTGTPAGTDWRALPALAAFGPGARPSAPPAPTRWSKPSSSETPVPVTTAHCGVAFRRRGHVLTRLLGLSTIRFGPILQAGLMHKTTVIVVATALLAGGLRVVSARSLADIARKEEERRKETKVGKTYTNKDLRAAPPSSTPPPPTATGSPAPSTGASEPSPAKPNDTKDQAHWAGG